MIKIYKSKQEYEAIEAFRYAIKNKKEYENFKSFTDVNASEKIISLAEEFSLFAEVNYFFVNCAKEEYLQTLNSGILKACEKSNDVFLFWGKTKGFQDFFEGEGFKIIEIKNEFKTDFPAGLVNAVQKKDKKNAWILFLKEKEILGEGEMNKLHGSLIYACKTALISRNMKSFDEASGLKQYGWSSTNKNIEGRTLEDLQKTYFDLIETHAQSRSGGANLGTLIEKWILNW